MRSSEAFPLIHSGTPGVMRAAIDVLQHDPGDVRMPGLDGEIEVGVVALDQREASTAILAVVDAAGGRVFG